MDKTANFVAAMGKAMAVFFLGICPLLVFHVPARASAGQDGAGMVIAAKQQAWAKRILTEDVLRSKSPVFTGDVVNTSPIGRLQILFRDNSALMMAPDSQVTINEYVYEGDEPSMRLGLTKGLTRFISGDIVKKRPGAMSVETPQAVASIQGTIGVVSVLPDIGEERFALVQITDGKELVVTLKKGKKLVLNRAGWEIVLFPNGTFIFREISPEDMARFSSLLAIATGRAGQPGEGTGSGQKASPEILLATGTNSSAVSFIPQSTWGAMYVESVLANAAMPSDFAGTYSGTISGINTIYSWNGNFSVGINDLAGAFQVNSVNIASASGLPVPFTLVGSGNLGTLTGDGGFSLHATPSNVLSEWGGSTGGWSGGDNVTINGQTNGKDMNLNINGTYNMGGLTGSGTGSK